jgi:hypothetical protein
MSINLSEYLKKRSQISGVTGQIKCTQDKNVPKGALQDEQLKHIWYISHLYNKK